MTSGPGTKIASATDLFDFWRGMMGAGGFAQPSLWLIFLDQDDRVLPPVVPIDDIPRRPDLRVLRNLAKIVDDLAGESDVRTVALLLTRPGPRAMTDDDRAWARAARDVFGERTRWPVHLATRDRMQVFAPDDLLAAG